MAEFDVTTGYDTWVAQGNPTQTNFSGRFPAIKGGGSDAHYPMVFMPLAQARIGGRTILSATLSGVAQGNWIDQTVTAQALSAAFKSTTNYNNRPGVTGATASSGATGALAAGERFEIDITALVQAIADGDTNFGWRLSTSQTTTRSTFRGFDSGLASWQLTVEVSDLPPAPDQLSPAGIISINKPVVSVDETDDMAAIQVQVDAAADGTSPDFDSGWRSTTTPQLNLANGMDRTASVTTANGSAAITYASGAIVAADVGATITGTGIPGGATILTAGATSGTISANATASGTIAATVTRAFAGLADGATTSWRARVKLTDGSISEWASWVEITRDVKPSIVMDNPSGTDIWDPTPTITAHLSPAGDADTRWQVIIQSATDPTDVRYNSGDALEGATLDHTVPLRWNGRQVMQDDGDYRLIVKAWDRSDRVPSPGDPTYVRTLVLVTLDVDGAITAPADLTATQATDGLPDVTLNWTRASDPDWFVVRRDGKFLATVDVDDYRVAPGEWEWVDETAEPNVTHTYRVRAVTDVAGTKKQSDNSNADTIFTTTEGAWLRSDFGDVQLSGDGMDAKQVDKRETFVLPYRSENVDIVTAVGGYEGTYSGFIANDAGAQDVDTVREILEDLRQSPHAEVRLIWGTQNRWVHLRGLSVAPDPGMFPADDRQHIVSFEFFEIDSRD